MTDLVQALLGDVEQFRRDYWQQRPFHHRGDERTAASILSIDELDEIFSAPPARPPYLEVKRAGQSVPDRAWTGPSLSRSVLVPDAPNGAALRRELALGATLIVNHLDDFHESSKQVCDQFHEAFGAPTRTAVFVTPPTHAGLSLHFDAFEGFIVQTAGTKRWSVWKRQLPLLADSKGLLPDDVGEPELDITLQPGDCLYVPWGAPHRAMSETELSCHITFMCAVPSWDDILRQAMIAAIPAAAHDEIVPLRSGGAPALRRYLDELRMALDEGQVLEHALAAASARPPRPARGRFLSQARAAAELGPDSLVQRTPHLAISVLDDEASVSVRLPTRTVRMPAGARSAVEVLLDGGPHSAHDVPSALPEAARLSVVRALVSCGALQPAR